MNNLLIEIKNEVESTKKTHNDHLDSSKISAFESKYDKIVEDGLKANPPPEKQPEKKGKVKQSPPKNLLDRLQSHKKSVLLFMLTFASLLIIIKVKGIFVWLRSAENIWNLP